ncbi:ABC transporter permease [Streptomyces sp. NBC_00190]|uniref:ABC transporter permease n=1 Tax=unclassified Streptomyces TaxID=2593676 RepID=UPI002E2D3BA3|nr:ABC transporter permease [Streptomyces sp. NBC_00190]WSZ39105.1 ABC transporter permease [Streptomyces sp. NBC_00868]
MSTNLSSATSARGNRLFALGRAELTMLMRNRSALFSALVLPLGSLVIMYSFVPSTFTGEGQVRVDSRPVLVTGTIGMVLLFVVYSNLVGAFVARREGMVLKRLRTGSLTDGEILAGTALPAAAVAWAQCGLVIGLGIGVLGLVAPADPALLTIGILVGTLLVAALAACTANFTRSVEMAQLTTMPLLLVSVAGSGLAIPSAAIPSWLAEWCAYLPLTSAMDLVRAGWLGAPDGEAVWPAALPDLVGAGAWTVAAVWAARTRFRWEARK